MSYDIFQHKHNFSVWAGARAVQRSWKGAKVKRLKAALESCGVVDFLQSDESLKTSKDDFNALHWKWCKQIINHLEEQGVKNVTFGKAAKLLAVYLKSMVVVGSDPHSELAYVVHPPVDRILLQNLSRSPHIKSPYKRALRYLNWTELDEEKYYGLMHLLASFLKDGEPMWFLEKYWTVTNE